MRNRDALRLALLLAVVMAARSAFAVAPEIISYQGLLTDDEGVVVGNGPYDLRFEIYNAPTAGGILFRQSLQVTVTDGLYNVLLSNNQLPSGGSLSQVFVNGMTYMAVVIEGGPGLTGLPITLAPRQQIASVPYALQSTAAPATIPGAIIDAATKTDPQPITQSGGTTTLLATGGGNLQAAITIPTTSYVVTVIVKVDATLAQDSSPANVIIGLLENCGGGSSVVEEGRWRKSGAQSRITITLLYVDETPAAATCTYGLTASTDNDEADLTINQTSGYTTILVRADPL